MKFRPLIFHPSAPRSASTPYIQPILFITELSVRCRHRSTSTAASVSCSPFLSCPYPHVAQPAMAAASLTKLSWPIHRSLPPPHFVNLHLRRLITYATPILVFIRYWQEHMSSQPINLETLHAGPIPKRDQIDSVHHVPTATNLSVDKADCRQSASRPLIF